MQKDTKSYLLSGLTLRSEIPLPGLPDAKPGSITDVTISRGFTPSSLRGGVAISLRGEATAREYLEHFEGVASFYVRDGEEIVVRPDPGASIDEIRSLLFSVVLAVLLFQRGLLPIHASAIEVRGRVFAFVGMSGSGKSSLAAYLSRRGYRIVADDLTLLDQNPGQVPLVVPCAPWLKLWRDALDGLKCPVDGLDPIPRKDWKYRVPIDGKAYGAIEAVEEPLPLGGLFLLEKTEDGEPGAINLLQPAQAVAKFMLYTYTILMVHKLGQTPALFRRASEALQHVSMWTLERPWGLEHFDAVLDMLEAHFVALGAEPEVPPRIR